MDRDRVVDLAQCQYRFFKHGRRGLRIAGDTNRSVLKELGTSIILIMTRWGVPKSEGDLFDAATGAHVVGYEY